MKFYFSLILFCFCIGLLAQDRAVVDVVETQNGVRYEGDITYFEYGKLLTITLVNGEEVNVAAREIKRIRYAKAKRTRSDAEVEKVVDSYYDSWKSDLKFTRITRSLRPSLAINMNGGKEPDRTNIFFFEGNRLFGFSIEGLIHYQLQSWLQLGIGAGFDRFNTRRSESVLSYLGSVQLLPLAEKKLAPVIKMTGGYGNPINTEGLGFDDSRGGILLHPGIGLRIGRVQESFFTIDLGYRLLTTEVTRPTFQGIETRTNNYRRFSLRVGATF